MFTLFQTSHSDLLGKQGGNLDKKSKCQISNFRYARKSERTAGLVPQRRQAICYHDGQYIPDNSPVALKEKPLLLLLHFADLWTAQLLENV